MSAPRRPSQGHEHRRLARPQGPPHYGLTPRQRTIIRSYFAHGCKAGMTARALGVNRCRLYHVRTRPGAEDYLDYLEAQAVQALAQARAAIILAPMLRP